MFKLINVCADFGRLKDYPRSRFVAADRPLTFSWGALHDGGNAKQSAYRVTLRAEGFDYDSGWVESEKQQCVCEVTALPEGAAIEVGITIRDNTGLESETYTNTIWNASVAWDAEWIGAEKDEDNKIFYLRREFVPRKALKDAVLYACGIGYHKVYLNGKALDDAALDPANTEFAKTCQYVMYPGLADKISDGANCVGAMLASGWRRNALTKRKNDNGGLTYSSSDGQTEFTAMLKLVYADGEVEWIKTNENWQIGTGAYVYADIFNGELCDARAAARGWSEVGFKGFAPAKVLPAPGGVLCPMTLNPIIEYNARKPIAGWPIGENSFVLDFGQNVAGVLRVKLPKLKAGQTVKISHAEELDEDGTLFMDPLRSAEQTDAYIAAGDDRDLEYWQPLFTYHGFRYARIDGLGAAFDLKDVVAVELHTDMEINSTFRCGDARVTQIHENCVMTERDNQHSILTDCPQRDERQGWMNDATVRFEETPYNFDIGRMFPKLIRDLMDAQSADGAITCTAPFIWGNRPADPVCSSFLIAGFESWLHLGNTDVLAEAYDAYAAWENCLLAHSDNYIVNYGYYGDWAGPVYACKLNSMGDGAQSAVTPEIFMSTGFSYLNCTLLAKYAQTLGKSEEAEKWTKTAETVKQALLDKWYNAEGKKMCTGSQACQCFSLWLGIIPEEDRQAAADRVHEELVANDYRFTTGNLCTRYMLDVLTQYGHLEDAWALMTKQTYPSYGYMIEQEATTIWERFELKKDPGMNSHNHPMFGSIDYWFFAYLCGIKPLTPAYEKISIKPYFPKDLMSAQAKVDTVKGEVAVRWMKRYGALTLHVTVPFGATAVVDFAGEQHEVGSGFHVFSMPYDC